VSGKVYIVGAGPGDPRLLTIRGLECLRLADVVVYDRLVDGAVLDQAPRAARRIFAGKEPEHHPLAQEAIHELLAEEAARGRTVVRLKGGDPFVFGRGGEEAEFLAARGIDFEIVPGVSSAIAVPGAAGIPLTHRRVSRAFAVVAGHTCSPDPEPDYPSLLRGAGTLVVLMGVRSLPRIVARLLEGGIDPATPAAVVENGTRPDQRTLVTTLAGLVAAAHDARAPAVIVVGEVVRLRERIRPLAAELAAIDAPSGG
jgi:uroporphyrin-III C-methyltransferase